MTVRLHQKIAPDLLRILECDQWSTTRSLSDELSASRPTVHRAIRHLRDLGVGIDVRKRGPGSSLTVYELTESARDYLGNLRTMTVGDFDQSVLLAALNFYAKEKETEPK